MAKLPNALAGWEDPMLPIPRGTTPDCAGRTETDRWGRTRSRSTFWWTLTIAALALAVVRNGDGFGTADAVSARQDDRSAEATATRNAELAEIATLQAQVAALQTEVAGLETQAALPSATPTPALTPTPVPATPFGQPATLAGGWNLVVTAVSARPSVEEFAAEGVFVEVVVTITNTGSVNQRFPVLDLVLTDSDGREFRIHVTATARLIEADMQWVAPGQQRDLRLVFDVPIDAGQPMVLASKTDPGFRVEVVLQVRG